MLTALFGLVLALLTPQFDRPLLPPMKACQWIVVDVRHGDGYTVTEEVLICNGDWVPGGKQ